MTNKWQKYKYEVHYELWDANTQKWKPFTTHFPTKDMARRRYQEACDDAKSSFTLIRNQRFGAVPISRPIRNVLDGMEV